MPDIRDPLQILLHDLPPENEAFRNITVGKKYLVVELQDGHRGIAGSPGPDHPPCIVPPVIWDISRPSHRQLLTAYYNALLNTINADMASRGPEEWIYEAGWRECIMIGFFKPLYKRLVASGLKVTPFDIEKDEPELAPMNQLFPQLGKIPRIISTPLIFVNRTWEQIFQHISFNHEVLLTGPSGTYHPAYTSLPGVRAIFGSTLPQVHDDLNQIIASGGGMQDFKHLVVKSSYIKSI